MEKQNKTQSRAQLKEADLRCYSICGPGPVNLGGELTVRHSALFVADDAHSCCYSLWQQLQQTTDKTSMNKNIFSFTALLMQPLGSFFPTLTFESLGSLKSGRISLFITRILLKTRVFADQAIWCFFLLNQVLFMFAKIYKHLYFPRQNLHNEVMQQYRPLAQYVNKKLMFMEQPYVFSPGLDLPLCFSKHWNCSVTWLQELLTHGFGSVKTETTWYIQNKKKESYYVHNKNKKSNTFINM